MDIGTGTLDAYYPPYHLAITAAVTDKGWKPGRDWQGRIYQGAEHEENAWARRLPEIFTWVLRK